MARTKLEGRMRRKLRIRKKVEGTAARPRLTVFRSNKQIYAQVVDDASGVTIAAATSLAFTAPALRGGAEGQQKAGEGGKRSAAEQVGEAVATACKQKGITQVVFDRNGYIYHGRIKALADAARKGGLNF